MYPPPPPSSSAPFEGRPPPSETEGNTGGAPRLFTHAQAELRLIARHVAEVRSLLLTPPLFSTHVWLLELYPVAT